MSKSLRNTTVTSISIADTGVSIPASSTYVIPPQDFALWAASINVETPIGNGNLVVNDGYDDLDPTLGLRHLKEESAPRSTSLISTGQVTTLSASTLTLSASSRLLHIFEGSTAGQILKLGDARTYTFPHRYEFYNIGTQPVTIRDNTNATIFSLAVQQKTWAILKSTATQAGVWLLEANFLGGTGGGNGNIGFGFDGTASSGRWLESLTNVSSQNTQPTIAGSKSIRSLSLAATASATVTITLFKNGVSLDTMTLTAQQRNTKLNLNHMLIDGDYLAARVTSGTCSRPVLLVWL